jgi:hypothetical protein
MDMDSPPIKAKKAKYTKKADLNSRPGKYFLAVKKGATKKDAMRIAGYGKGNNSMQIENSETFKQLAYKDQLLQKISLGEIADAHAENIRQDTDRGARNTAIKMAYDKIEPEGAETVKEEKVVFVMIPQANAVLKVEPLKVDYESAEPIETLPQ